MESLKQLRTVDLKNGNPIKKREEIKNYFLQTWETHEKLYTQLKDDEVFYHRGDPLRHIILFYFGHTAAFFINKLFLAKFIDKRIDPKLESVFAIGVDEMSWDDLNNAHYDWPEVKAVREYRKKTKEVILSLIDKFPLTLPITWESPFWIIMMCIEHERIHIETSSVLIRQLPLDKVVNYNFGAICKDSGESPENEMLTVKGGEIKLGKDFNYNLYAWDNEYGNHTEKVQDFKASKYLISNGEFLNFIKEKGYHTKEYWTEEGWSWKNYKEAEMPLFWRKEGNQYFLRLVTEEIPMPWDWPVEINYLEAKAYCNWLSKKENKPYRLPTEAEWYVLFEKCNISKILESNDINANINLEHYASSCPVNKFKQGDFYDVIGNVWQWTETPITGYPGFKVHPIYDDFSTPTFDGKHNLIKGGSWISTGNEITAASRYAFRRHFYQYAGLRVIESDAPLNIQMADYETHKDVTLSCDINWNKRKDCLASQIIDIIVKECGKDRQNKVLDINADTGRLAFELSQYYNDVTALDFTARMIRVAVQLQEQGYMRYISEDEGDISLFNEVVLDDYGLSKYKDNILFMQADPMNLKPIYTDYDIIIVPNLLKEIAKPKEFLTGISNRLNINGKLIIISDYYWNEDICNKEDWIGGFKKDGEPYTSLDGLKDYLTDYSLSENIYNIEYSIIKSNRVKEVRSPQVTIWTKIK